MSCGGLSELKKADAEVQALCDEIRGELERRSNRIFSIYTAISYKTQVVAGENYFVKIKVSESEYFHVRIFQALPCDGGKVSLEDYQPGKTADDDIVPF